MALSFFADRAGPRSPLHRRWSFVSDILLRSSVTESLGSHLHLDESCVSLDLLFLLR